MAQDSNSPLEPASGPSLVGMAGSLAKSMAQFAASGFRTVPKEIHAARVAQCAECEHQAGMQCRLCGCFIDAKGWMPHEDCPIGKWPA